MGQSGNRIVGVITAIVLFSPAAWASDSAVVNFSAQISDGTCDIQLSQHTLQFGVHRAVDFRPVAAVAMLPLAATVICSGATTPKLTVSGNTPYSSNAIFRDADSAANGVGFMIQRDSGNIDLESFYNESIAISNNASVTLSPVSSADVPQNEPFLLGLVRAGSEPVTPGTIKSTLTFTVSFD